MESRSHRDCPSLNCSSPIASAISCVRCSGVAVASCLATASATSRAPYISISNADALRSNASTEATEEPRSPTRPHSRARSAALALDSSAPTARTTTKMPRERARRISAAGDPCGMEATNSRLASVNALCTPSVSSTSTLRGALESSSVAIACRSAESTSLLDRGRLGSRRSNSRRSSSKLSMEPAAATGGRPPTGCSPCRRRRSSASVSEV
mmetsp:Transcript_16845/g.53902  ORF Transcript_16845/g.53902 Transcript_16845/m.53902 type:complete len:212 (+) Transcript_16845:551-1186(+)